MLSFLKLNMPDGPKIGERDNSVYGMRAGSQGWKGEDGKAKTQW